MELAEKKNNDTPEKEKLHGIGLWIGLLVAGLVKTPSAWQMASILMTARPPSPGSLWCEQQTRNVTEETTWDKCQPWDNASNTSGPCPRWEWQHDDSIIEEWNLVCDRDILIPVQQFFYLFGVLWGGIVCFFLSNRFGPRRILLGAMVTQIIFGTLVSFAPSYYLATLFRFLTAMSCTHMFTCGVQLCSKVLGVRGPRWKITVPTCYEHFWSLGTLTLCLFGYFISSWRLLQLCISLPTLLLLALSWTIPQPTDSPAPEPDSSNDKLSSSSVSISVSIIRVISVHIALACIIVNYYGGLLNSNSWGPHFFLNISLAGVSEILGVLLGLSFMLLQDLKWLALTVVLLIGGLPMAFCSCLPDPYHPDMVIFGSVGRVAAACALTQFSVQVGEFFPNTKVKKWTIFSATCFARLCLLSAPFINYLVKLNHFYPMIILGTLLILGSLSTGILLLTTKIPNQIKPK